MHGTRSSIREVSTPDSVEDNYFNGDSQNPIDMIRGRNRRTTD